MLWQPIHTVITHNKHVIETIIYSAVNCHCPEAYRQVGFVVDIMAPDYLIFPSNSHSTKCSRFAWSGACTEGQLMACKPSGHSPTLPHKIKGNKSCNIPKMTWWHLLPHMLESVMMFYIFVFVVLEMDAMLVCTCDKKQVPHEVKCSCKEKPTVLPRIPSDHHRYRCCHILLFFLDILYVTTWYHLLSEMLCTVCLATRKSLWIQQF